MKKNGKTAALIITIAMCLALLAACGGDGGDSGPSAPLPPAPPAPGTSQPANPGGTTQIEAPPEDVVNFAEHIDITLDSNMLGVINTTHPGATGSPARWAYMLIYDRLVENLGGRGFEPGLATEWSTTDHKTWKFTLREGVAFHNGDAFTAQDVVNTINISQAANAGVAIQAWRSVDRVNVINPHSIEIVLNNVNVDFLYDISATGGSILNKRAIDASPEEGFWIGTGAFYVTEFETNDYSMYARNENYWGEAPYTKSLRLRFVPEISARAIMLENNETQIVMTGGLSPVDADRFLADPNFNILSVMQNGPFLLGFNVNDPITGDVNFRKAVAHALYRPDVAMAAFGTGGVAPTDDAYWGVYMEFKHPNIPLREYNVDKAKEYLAASSWNGEEVEIAVTLATVADGVVMIQHQLGQIGIPVVINRMDTAGFGSYITYADNSGQMMAHAATMELYASSIRPHLMPNGSLNRASYNNPTVTEMLERAGTVTDEAGRRAIYHQVQEIMHEDVPYINIMYREFMAAAVPGVGGITFSSNMTHDLRYIYWDLDAG